MVTRAGYQIFEDVKSSRRGGKIKGATREMEY
jgi:hypothetical protein